MGQLDRCNAILQHLKVVEAAVLKHGFVRAREDGDLGLQLIVLCLFGGSILDVCGANVGDAFVEL